MLFFFSLQPVVGEFTTMQVVIILLFILIGLKHNFILFNYYLCSLQNIDRDADQILAILAEIPSEGSDISDNEDEEIPIVQNPIEVTAESDDDDLEDNITLSNLQGRRSAAVTEIPMQEVVSDAESRGVPSPSMMINNIPVGPTYSRNTRNLAETAATSSTQNINDIAEPKWRHRADVSTPEQFNEDTSLPIHITGLQNPTPATLFQLFWPDGLVEHIVYQTNLYAQQEGKPFVPVTKDEMKTFLGINLLMGIKKLPAYRDYWSSCPDLHDSFVSKFMTVNRFGWLLSHLHVNDNHFLPTRNSPRYDKLYKIRPLLDTLQHTFEHNYRPTEHMAIDESMIKFKGRSYLKQYMPKKPIKRGYKVWMLCTSSGYCLKFDIYTGKAEAVEKNLGARVVLDFTRDLQNKNYKFYFDNYFNSYVLQHELQKRKILACGTVNFTRKFLPTATLKEDKKMKRGDFDWRMSDHKILYVKWKDNRSVYFLSNMHDPHDVDIAKRKEKDGSLTDIPCPKLLKDYNAHMNFVDKFDQLKGNYNIDRRSNKWWHRIFFSFLDCCVVNAYIVYKDLPCSSSKKMSHKDFRREIYLELMKEPETRKRVSEDRLPTTIKKHKPYVSPLIRLEGKKHQARSTTSRRCALCSTKAKPVRTAWECDTCMVPLCIKSSKNCFAIFHKNK